MAETIDTPTQESTTTKVPLGTRADDLKTDAAIDDIVAQEADEALAAEDNDVATAADYSPELEDVTPRHKSHTIFWFIIVLFVIIAIASFYILTNPNL